MYNYRSINFQVANHAFISVCINLPTLQGIQSEKLQTRLSYVKAKLYLAQMKAQYGQSWGFDKPKCYSY